MTKINQADRMTLFLDWATHLHYDVNDKELTLRTSNGSTVITREGAEDMIFLLEIFLKETAQ